MRDLNDASGPEEDLLAIAAGRGTREGAATGEEDALF